MRCCLTETIKTSAKMLYTTCTQWNYLFLMHPSYVNGAPLDPKWLLFQIKRKSSTDCQFKHTARQWVVCRQLLCEIHSQHDPSRRGTAAHWSNALSKLLENCATYVTAPTGGTTCTFWAVRFTTADESPFPIGAKVRPRHVFCHRGSSKTAGASHYVDYIMLR